VIIMKVAIGADHAGFALKEHLKKCLGDWKIEFVDVGTHSTESVDYPDYAVAVADQVNAKAVDLGVLCCGSGIGISIAANKIDGIRAARCDEPTSARLSRQHNDANVLCLGERIVGPGVASDTLRAFLDGQFVGGRHAKRVEKIARLEKPKV
jgi:ribose 5-phosphate isomerase B